MVRIKEMIKMETGMGNCGCNEGLTKEMGMPRLWLGGSGALKRHNRTTNFVVV